MLRGRTRVFLARRPVRRAPWIPTPPRKAPLNARHARRAPAWARLGACRSARASALRGTRGAMVDPASHRARGRASASTPGALTCRLIQASFTLSLSTLRSLAFNPQPPHPQLFALSFSTLRPLTLNPSLSRPQPSAPSPSTICLLALNPLPSRPQPCALLFSILCPLALNTGPCPEPRI